MSYDTFAKHLRSKKKTLQKEPYRSQISRLRKLAKFCQFHRNNPQKQQKPSWNHLALQRNPLSMILILKKMEP